MHFFAGTGLVLILLWELGDCILCIHRLCFVCRERFSFLVSVRIVIVLVSVFNACHIIPAEWNTNYQVKDIDSCGGAGVLVICSGEGQLQASG